MQRVAISSSKLMQLMLNVLSNIITFLMEEGAKTTPKFYSIEYNITYKNLWYILKLSNTPNFASHLVVRKNAIIYFVIK